MKRLLSMSLLAFSCFAVAQKSKTIWKVNAGMEMKQKSANAKLPEKKLYDLDLTALQDILVTSPKRTAVIRSSNTVISLPNAEGVFENFRVFENSVMEEALAANYPEIKSYVAVGVENPNARVYFSYSPLGFKSMTLRPGKSPVFIEPLTTDLTTYTVYQKSDYTESLTTMECKVIDEAVNSMNNTGELLRPNADDAKLRTFRLALSCTGEYATYFGGTKALALAGMNNTLTRVNGIFETDFGLRLVLIANNDNVIYTNAATDPYANYTSMSSWNSQLQSTLTSVIGEANYDIGHLLGGSGGGGNAGCIGCICVNGSKGRGYTSPSSGIPAGDNFDIDYVAHEIGHQLGANHTYSYVTEAGTGAQMEPGSGSTIMSYAGITTKDIQRHSDPYFHAISIQQVTNNIKNKVAHILTATGNHVPVVNAGLDYTIPKGTPFMLTGNASDANGDVLTYNWEQMDLGTTATGVPNATATAGPVFRSYIPTTSPTRYFPRMASVLSGLTITPGTEIPWEVLPNVGRTLNFRLTVRDNRAGGPSNNSDDVIVTVNGTAGPFTLNSPNSAVTYSGGSTQTITWNVAGTTANGVNCASVDILLSTDGGLTFPITVLSATPNDGSQNVVIPNMAGSTNRIMIKGSNHIFFDVSNTNFTITAGTTTADIIAPIMATLSASGTTVSTTNLSWSATDNVGVTSYDIYQNGIYKASTTNTNYTVSGLFSSTTYSFYVIAKDAAGNSSVPSNNVSVNTLSTADTIAPTSPILGTSGTTTSSTNLSWSAATDNVGVIGYDLYQNGVFKATTTNTNFTVNGLSSATNYSFYVRAKDAAGNTSASSNTVSVNTLSTADTIAPTSPILSASGTTTSSTNLSWSNATDNVGVIGYDLYQNGVFKATTTYTNFTVNGLSSATNYSFYVRAKDAAGNTSASSNTVTVNTLSAVAAVDTIAPTSPILTVSGTTSSSTNLSWSIATDNVGVTGYDIYRSGQYIGSTTARIYAVSGLNPSTFYHFYVRAKDAAGNASFSNSVGITTLSNSISYCTSTGNNSMLEYINRVQIGDINNLSGNNGGYADFTHLSTNLALYSNNTITLTPTRTSAKLAEAYSVWIDFNQDGDFNDAGEQVFNQSKTKSNSISGQITIPATALLGATRMRVSMKNNAFPTACETFPYGEVEDYTVIIIAGEKLEPETVIVKSNLKIYPNPVTGEVLNIANLEYPANYRIYNMLGQDMAIGKIENDSVDVATLKAGTYIIEIMEGGNRTTKRFIKQ